jgi:hypothetical protein
MCLHIVTARRRLQTVAETCSNAFVSYTLVHLADNKCSHVASARICTALCAGLIATWRSASVQLYRVRNLS